MKQVLKIVLWGAAGLAVLLAAGAAILAATFDPNRYKPEIERLAREQTGRTLKLGGDLRLAFFPSVGARVARVSLSERAGGEEFASVESAHASVKVLPLLRGNVIVDSLRISGLKAQVIKGRDGKFNFDDLLEAGQGKAPAAKPVPAQGGGVPLELAISGVRIERSSVTYRDLAAGSEFVLSDFSLSTGHVAERAQGKLKLGAALKGTKPQLDARLDAAAEYRLDLAKKTLAAPKLAVDVAVASSDMPMKAFKLAITGSLHADLEKQTFNADLVTRVDESTIQSKLGLARFTPASYRFDVSIDRLDLDRYLPREGAQPASAAQPAPAAAKEADTPIDLSFLKGLDASGKLQVGALQVRGLKLADVRAEVKAAGGRMDIAPHSASLYQGAVEGALALQADGNRIALKETLSGVAIGELLRDTAKTDRLQGKGNLALDVTGAGRTVGAMKKSLAGTGKLNLTNGAIKGIDIAAALRKADSPISLGRRRAAAEQTDFNELSASFLIKDGVARNEDLALKSPVMRAEGRGHIDVGNSNLDYRFKAALAGNYRVTVPVRVVGSFADPEYEINYAAVAADVAKTKVGDRVKDGVKRLLGR